MKYDNLMLITLIDAIGCEFYDSNLIGNQPPTMKKRWDRMNNPQPGDLVYELSTSSMRIRGDLPQHPHIASATGIGILVKIVQEAVEEEDWDEVKDGSKPTEKVYYIRRLDDGQEGYPYGENVFRWTNARFFTLIPHEGWQPWSDVLA